MTYKNIDHVKYIGAQSKPPVYPTVEHVQQRADAMLNFLMAGLVIVLMIVVILEFFKKK
jgi:hypothetical protein